MRRTIRTLISTAALLAILVPTSACAFLQQLLGNIQYPVVKVTQMVPELKDIATAVLHFKLAIKNPNPVGFKLAGIGYGLDVEGKHVADGRTRKGLTLKANGKSATAVDVNVKLIEIAASFLELLGKPSAAYAGTFDLEFDTPVGKINIPIKHSGKFPLPQKPPIALEGIQISGVDFSGVKLLAKVRIDNPNPFRMPVDALRMNLKVNNRDLAGVTAPAGLAMEPGQPLRIPLTVNASFGAIGLTAADLTRRPNLAYKASMNLASGPLKLPADLAGTFRFAN